MNVLIVDDQISVINGIMSGVHFKELGINVVRSATSSEEALAVFNEIPIDIMLTDIEMPGENGLELNKKIQEKYPDTQRILLTSHAEFSYAQESIKLGCFDYLLQPSPYEEIEECLLRALQHIYQQRLKTRLYEYGQLLQTNETELMDHVVTELFSRAPEDVNSSMEFLNKMGYPISKEKKIQVIIIDVKSFRISDTPNFSEKSIHKAIKNSLQQANITYPILALSTVSRFRQFALVLFSATSEDVNIPVGQYQVFYEKLSAQLTDEALTCYIGNWIACENVRDELKKIHLYIDENVSNSTGIYLITGQDISATVTTNLAESIERWETLISAGQKRMLDDEIEAFLQSTLANSKNKLKSLCELHQQLTHIFFGFFYDNNADTSKLFNEKYTYPDYMNSFKDTDSLRKAVSFMLNAIDDIQKNNVAKSDVEKAKSFIANNISKPITVKDVADSVNLSAEYFTKLFKRATGQNIKEYIARSKISAAKEMLEHSNISVSMITLELGYSYFSHFTQVFKKYEHMTPSEYRSKFTNQ
jgi:YesN/AraC family two-component response regulator